MLTLPERDVYLTWPDDFSISLIELNKGDPPF